MPLHKGSRFGKFICRTLDSFIDNTFVLSKVNERGWLLSSDVSISSKTVCDFEGHCIQATLSETPPMS
jgi:hypothetical protein